MLRYIAMVWDATNPAHVETERLLSGAVRGRDERWREILSGTGLSMFCEPNASEDRLCQRLDQGRGVVLGTVFNSRGSETGYAPYRIDKDASRHILATAGRSLVESCWGSYVAVLKDEAERVTVLRSPQSTMACLHTSFRGVHIIFSSLSDLPSFVPEARSINWSYFARMLLKLDEGTATGFNEISEIRGGESIHFARGHISSELYWDGLSICAVDPVSDARQAAQTLRTTVRSCVQALASSHETVILRLSGGLDSSIVLTCLQDAPQRPNIVCVNRYSDGHEADERHFARLAADRARSELIELRREPTLRFERMLQAQASERPQDYITQLSQYVPECEVARGLGASAVFSGDFGDQLFFGPVASLAVTDYVHDHGIGPDILRVALNAAKLEARSVWQVLRQSVPKGFRRSRWDPRHLNRQYDTLLVEDVASSLAGATTEGGDWYRRNRYVPPGKQYHLSGIPNASGGFPPFAQTGDPLYQPCLLSQPIVELCLHTPTYILTHGGWDRAFAREAFAQDLPPQIARRRSKGGQGDYSLQLIRQNIDFVRAMLLDGQLVKQGLLDRRKLEEALSDRPSKLLKGTVRLRRYLSIEIWLSILERNRLAQVVGESARNAA